jgi:NRAMP (natural resistance-associated macrophage protein)-like metal ion transporter
MQNLKDTYQRTYEQTAHVLQETEQGMEEYWHILGPGLTTGASDDDPSGIATYSQTGAVYGFGLIWMSLFTFPLMSVVQEMCARIGLVTGQGLAANIRRYYSKPVLYTCTVLLLLANIFNIGANLGAMAEALRLITPAIPFGLLVVFFGVTSLLLQIYTSYEEYAKYLKYLALVLLAYVVSALMVSMNWSEVLHSTFVPSFVWSKDLIIMMCAILGTTISPYLFFWQTSQEVEEKILKKKSDETRADDEYDHTQPAPGSDALIAKMEVRSYSSLTRIHRDVPLTKKDITNMRVDVWTGMFISNLVMFFIIASCAATLHAAGLTGIQTAGDAAEALRPFAGDFAFVLFALGIIGTGMLAIPVLAGSAAYAVSESFGWKFGLYRKLKEAYAFYGVIALATVVGIALNFIGLDPIKALIYSAVGNGLVAPVILFLIVSMSSRSDIMGDKKNGVVSRTFGWITVGLMVVAALGTIWALVV